MSRCHFTPRITSRTTKFKGVPVKLNADRVSTLPKWTLSNSFTGQNFPDTHFDVLSLTCEFILTSPLRRRMSRTSGLQTLATLWKLLQVSCKQAEATYQAFCQAHISILNAVGDSKVFLKNQPSFLQTRRHFLSIYPPTIQVEYLAIFRSSKTEPETK